ncbi:cytochrome P450 [Actinomadura rugatobispora]|uniref:Cytochrome P450 n=1 Tax=Actinomadura rugatobispora TaxID=1994 RepID=A0ABW1ABP8_9ACTN|nr:cytochrome P450 [Actinomadura rugatobispora]
MTIDSSTASPEFDFPFEESERLELDPRYLSLRRETPVIRVRLPHGTRDAWLVTGYDEARAVLSDPRFSLAACTHRDVPRVTPNPLPEGSLLSMDGPEHARLRRLVAKTFTMRRVESLRPRAVEVTEGLMDEMAEQGAPADLVESFAMKLPIIMICELLGVPLVERARFHSFARTVLSNKGITPEEIGIAAGEIYSYIVQLIAERREESADDLISALIEVRDERGALSEHELVLLVMSLLIGGNEGTANAIGNFMYTLLSNRHLWDQLVEDPELVTDAIEELLRVTPLVAGGGFTRVALEDVQIGDVLVRKGEAVISQLDVTNRDERIFEGAEECDFSKKRKTHMSFGHGIHHCLGAALVRMEIAVALTGLIQRFPNLRIAVPEDELPWKKGTLDRGLHGLPVAW